MRCIKNVAVSVGAHIEKIATRFENHQAVVLSMITEMEQAVAKVKVQLGSVRRNIELLSQKKENLASEEYRWIERARKVASIDEGKAIECVRRLKQVREKIAGTGREFAALQEIEIKLSEQCSVLDGKLHTLRMKKNDLVARQNCADAMNISNGNSDGIENDIEAIFTRWETDITGKEIRAEATVPESDLFEKEFSRNEENDELKKMLMDITGNDVSDTSTSDI